MIGLADGQVGPGDVRVQALAHAGRRLAMIDDLDGLVPIASQMALDVIAASSASLSRVERERGLVRVLGWFDGRTERSPLQDGVEPQAEDELLGDVELHRLADLPRLAAPPEDAHAWCANLGDPSIGAVDRRILRRMGMQASLSVPIVAGGSVWGEVRAARSAHLPPFSSVDVALGEAFGGLLAAALVRIQSGGELHELAYHDPLTGLANRRSVDDLLERLFAPEVPAQPIAAIVCDVDGLKTVNDRFGHHAGDALLCEVASSLALLAGDHPGALAARLGGDEFCLILEGVSESEVAAISERLAASADGLSHGAGLSCGWARVREHPGQWPDATAAARALLRLADAAQYRAKRAGRQSATVPPRPDDGFSWLQRRCVEAAITALRLAGPRPEERLEAVAAAVAKALEAGAWAVSRAAANEPVHVVARDAQRGVDLTPNRLWQDDRVVDADHYPQTRKALEGGSFQATVAAGERGEREFLAALGYDEVIGAGTRSDHATAWLVEVYGDAVTVELGPHEGLLRALVELAVAGAPASSQRGRARAIRGATPRVG